MSIFKKKLTVNEWLDIWLDKYKKNALTTKSFEKYVSSLKYVREVFGSKFIDKLSAPEFQCFIDELLEIDPQGVLPETMMHSLSKTWMIRGPIPK